MTSKTVLIMAGGTGGHVFPGLAVADELKSRGYGVEWLGTSAGIEAKLVPAAGIRLNCIHIRGLRGKRFIQVVGAPWNILRSIAAAMRIIKNLKPALVIGLGGYVTGPGGIAARLLGLPLVIHEQNAVAGTTNKILARFANRVLTAFPNVLGRGRWIGNPVRASIQSIPDPAKRYKHRREKGTSVNILVLGGSRGAKAINELIPESIAFLESYSRFRIWHQTGQQHRESTEALYEQYVKSEKSEMCRLVEFIDDMAEALSWADIVICRSGALTISEIATAGIAAILIPFPFAIDDHQTENAKYLSKDGAAILCQQRELTAERLADLLNDLVKDLDQVEKMASIARSKSKLDSVELFANCCENLMNA